MPRRAPSFHVPSGVGRAALAEIDHVRFDQLDHAYGTGKVGDRLHEDVAATLRRLADEGLEAFDEALEALYSNVVHQGTIYEASAHAVPFLAAFAADPSLPGREVRAVVALLAFVCVATSVETDDGTMSGAFGEDVADHTRAAFRSADSLLEAIERQHPRSVELIEGMRSIARSDSVDPALCQRVYEIADRIADSDAGAPSEESAPVEAAAPRWFRHAKFGVGLLVREEHNGLRLRFDDGAERVIVARFLREVE